MKLFEELDLHEDIGFKKTERYKGSMQRKDVLRIIPAEPAPGIGLRNIIKTHFYMGKRANGTTFFVNKHTDPKQNYAAELGYEEQTGAACLVIVLAWSPPQNNSQWTWDLRVLPWTFGNDKKKQFEKFSDMGLDLSKQEFLVRCEKEDFQKLDITVVHSNQQFLPQLPQDKLAALKQAIAEAIPEYQKFVAPHNRLEQQRIISGNDTPQANVVSVGGPSIGPGFAPSSGFPTGAPPVVAAPSVAGGDPLSGLIGQQSAPVQVTSGPSLVAPSASHGGPRFDQGQPSVEATPVTSAPSGPVMDVPAEVKTEPAVAVSGIVSKLLNKSAQ